MNKDVGDGWWYVYMQLTLYHIIHEHFSSPLGCQFPFYGPECDNAPVELMFARGGINHKPIKVSPKVDVKSLSFCTWIKDSKNKKGSFRVYFTAYSAISDNKGCNAFLVSAYRNYYQLYLKEKRYKLSKVKVIYNKWIHLCLTWSGKAAKLYINGDLKGNVTTPTTSVKISDILLGNDVDRSSGGVCKANDVSQGFIGQLTRSYVWNRELSPLDVKIIYKGQNVDGILKKWNDFLKPADTQNVYKRFTSKGIYFPIYFHCCLERKYTFELLQK